MLKVAFALQERGWLLRSDIIWHRPNKSESVQDRPTHAHEYFFMFSKNQHYYYDQSAMKTITGANRGTVWTVHGAVFTDNHAAVFPAELIDPIIRAACPVNGVVLDPFAGTGTVGVVCRQYHRQFILCEISPEYAQLAQKRVTEGIIPDDKQQLSESLMISVM